MQRKSQFLTAGQFRGLEKLGDIYAPGDAEFPSFSQLGCAAHMDEILSDMPERERRALRQLLGTCRYLPRWLLVLFVRLAEVGPHVPIPPGSTLRFVRLGLRSIAYTLYYSGRAGPDYEGPTPHQIIDYDVSVYTDDMKTENDV